MIFDQGFNTIDWTIQYDWLILGAEINHVVIVNNRKFSVKLKKNSILQNVHCKGGFIFLYIIINDTERVFSCTLNPDFIWDQKWNCMDPCFWLEHIKTLIISYFLFENSRI